MTAAINDAALDFDHLQGINDTVANSKQIEDQLRVEGAIWYESATPDLSPYPQKMTIALTLSAKTRLLILAEVDVSLAFKSLVSAALTLCTDLDGGMAVAIETLVLIVALWLSWK